MVKTVTIDVSTNIQLTNVNDPTIKLDVTLETPTPTLVLQAPTGDVNNAAVTGTLSVPGNTPAALYEGQYLVTIAYQ